MRFFITFYRGLADVFRDARVRALIAFTITLIALASVLFWLVEGWPLLDAAFFSVVTISTVGYGNITPVTALGKIICMIYIMLGMGVFVAAASAVAEALLKRNRDRVDSPDR